MKKKQADIYLGRSAERPGELLSFRGKNEVLPGRAQRDLELTDLAPVFHWKEIMKKKLSVAVRRDPLWIQDVETVSKELTRISRMFEKLKQNTLDDELRDRARDMEVRAYILGEKYLYTGNKDALR
jgi:hypothetical protein